MCVLCSLVEVTVLWPAVGGDLCLSIMDNSPSTRLMPVSWMSKARGREWKGHQRGLGAKCLAWPPHKACWTHPCLF